MHKAIEASYQSILSQLPLTNEEVDKTPARAARAMMDLCSGYRMNIAKEINGGIFPHPGETWISVKDIEICSLCEHHLLPFFGSVFIAYISQGQILGLSKLKRVANVFSRRLQVQERLTQQIAQCIEDLIQPKGVIVVVRAIHTCMKMRGVRERQAETMTVATLGVFQTDSNLRQAALNESGLSPRL